MDDNKHSWGGYRPGAGQKPKWNSGSTVTIRVPQELTSEILLYAQLIDGQSPNDLQIENCLSCLLDNVTESKELQKQSNQHKEPKKKERFDGVTESNYQEALLILHSALNLKANAGGAIKAEIKRALNLLNAVG